MVGDSCLWHRSHFKCSSAYETQSITFTEILENKFSRFREKKITNYYSKSNSTSTVVFTLSEHFQGQIVAIVRSRDKHNHRYNINRVWESHEQSNSSREMRQTSQTPSYPLSCVFITEIFSKSSSEQNNVDRMQ